MQDFRDYLQNEFAKRVGRNPSYSLRSFARQLNVHHATLSSFLSGKRKITKAAILKISKTLDLGPDEVAYFSAAASVLVPPQPTYLMIQQDAFAAMSEWYFDAILEMTRIRGFRLEPAIIAESLQITEIQARHALETLMRLELLVQDKSGKYKLEHENTVNLLDDDFTSVAHRKYQKTVLLKSLEALEEVERRQRDHTSTTMAIQAKDISKAKELIKKFRRDLDAFMQRDGSRADAVYQLQVSFFPLTAENRKRVRK